MTKQTDKCECGYNKDSSVPYTPLTYKFKTYSGLEVVDYRELASALNGLRQDINSDLRLNDCDTIEPILELLNKWFPVLKDDEAKEE